MRILAVSDTESRYFYDFYEKGKLDEIDLILACGDLKREYLEFLVTMSGKPLLYVPGNHDDSFDENPPGGCVCIDGKLYVQDGIRILGLGGSYRYRPGIHQYTERQMRWRILKVLPSVLLHGGFDILLTHAPARGLGDLENRTHRGFECFLYLLDRFRPRYLVHGHVHRNYGHKIPQKTLRDQTTIINAYDYCVFEYE